MEQATFGAGCFWGVESFFREVAGVFDAACGYAGGTLPNPAYRQVCSGTTGHAEVVQVTYDPTKVSYDRLLGIFFANHDPTTLNREGPYIGTQLRSAILVHSAAQEAAAKTKIETLGKTGKFRQAITTTIEPFTSFYRAEEYHQRYFEKNGLPSCHVRMPDS